MTAKIRHQGAGDILPVPREILDLYPAPRLRPKDGYLRYPRLQARHGMAPVDNGVDDQRVAAVVAGRGDTRGLRETIALDRPNNPADLAVDPRAQTEMTRRRQASASFGPPTASFMLRNGRWKYIDYVGNPPELFDSANDPFEERDRASDRGVGHWWNGSKGSCDRSSIPRRRVPVPTRHRQR